MPVKSVPIVLNDGKTRQLRFEWEALENLERELGLSIFELGPDIIAGKVGVTKMAVVIWAGLSFDEKNLQLSDVRKLLDSSEFLSYTGKIAEALESVFEEKKVKNATGSNPKKVIPGKNT